MRPAALLPAALVVLGARAALTPATRPAATPAPPREGYVVAADSTRLYYRVEGSGHDTIIAVHGGPGVDLESIRADFAPLTRAHVVVFYDQRGTGRSTLPADTTRLSATTQISDLDAVRRHFGLARVALVAHSYGPLLAATYALAHPAAVSRMVFFGGVPPRRGDYEQAYERTMNAHLDSTQRARLADAGRRLADPAADARQACRDYWAVALRPRLAEPDRTLPLLRSDLCTADGRAIRYGLTVTNPTVMATYGDWDLRPGLRTLDTPTLVVHGEADAIPLENVREWAAVMPHARLVPVPNAGHFAYAERPDVVWPVVLRFLAR
ncbi:amino acid amidase [Gemmatimonadetes bacterium T265]|nr:amino acid amidase [Gemmatimonadetes bacterium T265]